MRECSSLLPSRLATFLSSRRCQLESVASHDLSPTPRRGDCLIITHSLDVDMLLTRYSATDLLLLHLYVLIYTVISLTLARKLSRSTLAHLSSVPRRALG